MNIYRFFSLPNATKPAILIIALLAMLITLFSHFNEGKSGSWGWFFWLTIIIQVVFMACVVGLFTLELEAIATCGRDQWPLFEMIYSAVFIVM
jgi:hypothetical protein